MSPFSQITSANTGYGAGIDRDFSPVLNYLDEFDRHFSRRHRFVNCFIPRFDLEEDAHNYYLYGDIPGASVEDITVEAHDNHTLVVYGATHRAGPERADERHGNEGVGGGYVKVNVEDNENGRTNQEAKDSATSSEALSTPATTSSTAPTFPPPPTVPVEHPHHQRQPTQIQAHEQPQRTFANHKILISERLVGEFRRTFAFPADVEEKEVRASMENGVLSLVVPKRQRDVNEKDKGRRIPILQGRWWSGDHKGNGYAFPGGAV